MLYLGFQGSMQMMLSIQPTAEVNKANNATLGLLEAYPHCSANRRLGLHHRCYNLVWKSVDCKVRFKSREEVADGYTFRDFTLLFRSRTVQSSIKRTYRVRCGCTYVKQIVGSHIEANNLCLDVKITPATHMTYRLDI